MGKAIPNDLTALEYARHILEFELCWPAKSNIELIADCISAISKGRSLALPRAYKYLARAISLAREQKIVVDRMFFLNGDYMNVRPARPIEAYPQHRAVDRERTEQEQSTPEWQEANRQMRALLARLAGKAVMQ